ncbi:signal transduction histidine kinase [Streptomyces pseudovenezuelae]|uniref:histidine kinase n=1 Tax=Streptomyces pseudovenezuelae TaxID=67350 RepID=A0ABT6LTT7_9ACTN|nr:signal transduction histidine kinase [Streptomyces pseudovenezuelae]
MSAPESAPAPGPAPDREPGPRVVPRQDARLHGAITLAVVVISIATVRPVGLSGRGLAVAALLAVNSIALMARHLPEARFPPRVALLWLTVGVVAAAALLGVSGSGSSYLFAYFLVGHIGYRLPLGQALALAALSSLLCGAVLYFRLGPGHELVPWTLGVSTGLPVVAGILSRSRQRAVEAMIASAESAERAARAEARTAVLTERSRIARDVHDVLAHSLAGINMQLELADALIDTGDLEKVREANGKAHSMVRESLKQAQWTVHALREDSLPLLESLTAMIESSGHRDALTVTGTVRELPARVTQNLLRIAQEALTNAGRHAPGAKLGVELTFAAASSTLVIHNGPATREAAAGVGSGLGLIGMRERVALLGGTITAGPVVEGPEQGGWQVEAVIPG